LFRAQRYVLFFIRQVKKKEEIIINYDLD